MKQIRFFFRNFRSFQLNSISASNQINSSFRSKFNSIKSTRNQFYFQRSAHSSNLNSNNDDNLNSETIIIPKQFQIKLNSNTDCDDSRQETIISQIPTDLLPDPYFLSSDTSIQKHRKKRVACAMSSGVDSSVSASLLVKQGFEVIGVYMVNWDETIDNENIYDKENNMNSSISSDHHPTSNQSLSLSYSNNQESQCSQVEKERQSVQSVCSKLTIEYHECNFVKEYWNSVFDIMLNSYSNGNTPNPDINCNKYIKFGILFNYIRNVLKCDYLATGHYAKIQITKAQHESVSQSPYDNDLSDEKIDLINPPQLLQSLNKQKDQSYFLSSIDSNILKYLLFPIGSFSSKTYVRQYAKQVGLIKQAKQADSMGICFINNYSSFKKFLSSYLQLSKCIIVANINSKILQQFPMNQRQDSGIANLTSFNRKLTYNANGELILGYYNGIERFTLGQSIHINGLSKKWYVAEKRFHQTIQTIQMIQTIQIKKKSLLLNAIDNANNDPRGNNSDNEYNSTLVLTAKRTDEIMCRDDCQIDKINWIGISLIQMIQFIKSSIDSIGTELYCKTRSTEEKRKCYLKINNISLESQFNTVEEWNIEIETLAKQLLQSNDELNSNNNEIIAINYIITFAETHFLLVCGQTIAFYSNNDDSSICYGGGEITKLGQNYQDLGKQYDGPLDRDKNQEYQDKLAQRKIELNANQNQNQFNQHTVASC